VSVLLLFTLRGLDNEIFIYFNNIFNC